MQFLGLRQGKNGPFIAFFSSFLFFYIFFSLSLQPRPPEPLGSVPAPLPGLSLGEQAGQAALLLHCQDKKCFESKISSNSLLVLCVFIVLEN